MDDGKGLLSCIRIVVKNVGGGVNVSPSIDTLSLATLVGSWSTVTLDRMLRLT